MLMRTESMGGHAVEVMLPYRHAHCYGCFMSSKSHSRMLSPPWAFVATLQAGAIRSDPPCLLMC